MIDLLSQTSIQKNGSAELNQAAARSKETAKATANFDAFLQLLVTQLKNQDPLKPMDPTQTVTQLATFASVEQSIQANARLATLSTQSNLSQASDLIGRRIISSDGATVGVIQAVKTGPDGLSAFLQDGNMVPLTSGVTIGEK